MSKGLEALEDIILYLNATEPQGLYCENIEVIKKDLERLEKLEKENKILKEGINSLLNYCDDLHLYEEKPYHITEEGIKFYFLDYEEKEDLEKIKLMFEVLENGN